MNKSDLVDELASRARLPRKRAEFIVDHIFDLMTAAMVRGERIELRGFGAFQVKTYAAYTGRNPKTGQKIDVAAKKLPVFKTGKDLKGRVGGGGGPEVKAPPQPEPQTHPETPAVG